MKNSIFVIILSIVFGFSNISQQQPIERWIWDNTFAEQIYRLFDTPFAEPLDQLSTRLKCVFNLVE